MKRATHDLSHVKEELANRIKTFEEGVEGSLAEKEREFQYYWHNGKAKFAREVVRQHRRLKRSLGAYILRSRLLVALTAPLIYLCIIPFLLLDLFVTLYQVVCFPIYGIPLVRRANHIVFDRGRLAYLNLLERLNCIYCSYANGICSYVTEIAGRTEQHWCPIKHARRLQKPHSRYGHFFDYGDAQRYWRQVETVRRDFGDLETRNTRAAGSGERAGDGAKKLRRSAGR